MNTRAISESSINTEGRILIRVHPFTDDLEIGDGGLKQKSEPGAWTINHPSLRDRDVIVRYSLDGNEEFRYEILDVTRNRLFFGESGKQQFRMIKLDKTDQIYQFSV